MPTNKLHRLLTQLDGHERLRLQKLIHSPYFTESEDLQRLWQCLTDDLDLLLDKPQLWQRIFGQRPYNDAHLRRLYSDLTQLAHRLLALDHLPEVEEQLQLLPVLARAGLTKHFDSTLRKIDRALSHSTHRHADHYLHHYRVATALHHRQEQRSVRKHTLDHLVEADRALDIFYLATKLRHHCIALDYANFMSLQADIPLPTELEAYISDHRYQEYPAVSMYAAISDMQRHPDVETLFDKVLHLLEQYADCFPHEEAQALYTMAQNYCITKINRGRQAYYHRLFDLYRQLLDKRLLHVGDHLPTQHYKNIVTVGLKVEAYDWTENFIQQQSHDLPAEEQENALTYNLAKLYFEQGDYAKTIAQLRDVDYTPVYYALGGRLLLLKSYYALREDRALDILIDSFTVYLRRNRVISGKVRKQYLDMVRYVRKLAYLPPGDRAARQQLRDAIAHNDSVAGKRWLLTEVDARG